jgi:hypothetical protein
LGLRESTRRLSGYRVLSRIFGPRRKYQEAVWVQGAKQNIWA